MNGEELRDFIRENGIRTVFNLRGSNPDQAWYRDEISATAAGHARHLDARLSAGEELTTAQMNEIVALLRSAAKPILIHCSGGADRSGLIAALYRYKIEGCSPEVASGELSFRYGHAPFIRPRVAAMDRSFENFVTYGDTLTPLFAVLAR